MVVVVVSEDSVVALPVDVAVAAGDLLVVVTTDLPTKVDSIEAKPRFPSIIRPIFLI